MSFKLESWILIDLYEFSQVYNQRFSYWIEEKTVLSWLQGKGYDNRETYTEVDHENLRLDLDDLSMHVVSEELLNKGAAASLHDTHKLFLVTAGAPGAGKTRVLRDDLKKRAQEGKMLCYVCPDDVCLQHMRRTYRTMRSFRNSIEPQSFVPTARRAYDKWRPASNAAAHLLLANLLARGFPIALGSTSTSPLTMRAFSQIKHLGYRLELIYVAAPDNVRWKSIKERDRRFVQVTEKDTLNKAKDLMTRIYDSYLTYADHIDFYWRPVWNEGAILVARWDRPVDCATGQTGPYKDASEFLQHSKNLQIIDREGFEELLKDHLPRQLHVHSALTEDPPRP